MVLVIAVYVIYYKGPALRARSPFAQQLGVDRAQLYAKISSARISAGVSRGAHTIARLQQQQKITDTSVTSPFMSRFNSLCRPAPRRLRRAK